MVAAAAKRRGGSGGGRLPLGILAALVALLVVAVLVRWKLQPPRPSDGANTPAVTSPSAKKPAAKPHRSDTVPETPGYGQEPPPRRLPPVPPPEGTTVAIVLDDTGYRLDLVEEACRTLPRAITFAVIPFLPHSEASADYAHANGFPVILHCPMEPEDSARWKTTPGTIMVGMPPREVERIIRTDVAAIPHVEGVNNHMGSRATADASLMKSVMASLKGTGLYFLDSRTTKFTVARQAAREAGLRSAERSVFLDDVDDPGAIMVQLDQLVTRAGQEGALVGIGHLRANTIKVLAERIPYWEGRGVRFRPLREVVR